MKGPIHISNESNQKVKASFGIVMRG
ncbi:Protein of unknown function [Bacillus mycoides]|uniref:Uncharacterized protein n=1 Tax=Bacillus mycoides TaxID=1405 RepID=A0A1C4GFH6_BACMY|nr:Protein of unknown function [Bacillus mycoides]SCC66575.1 Protein of unknown function [Bacillus mycoides]